jgi:hypothetical protein
MPLFLFVGKFWITVLAAFMNIQSNHLTYNSVISIQSTLWNIHVFNLQLHKQAFSHKQNSVISSHKHDHPASDNLQEFSHKQS